MIEYSARALRQVAALSQHYRKLQRYDAADALAAALAEAERKIADKPASGFAAPRPYPHLALAGRAWVKAGRYWVGYRTTPQLSIFAVFYEEANIPGRFERDK